MEAAQRDDSPEKTPKVKKPGWDEQLMEPDKKREKTKKKAAGGQLPSLSKQTVAALAVLTRALISQPKTKPQPTVQQQLGMAQAFQEPQPQLTPQVVEPPPVVVLQAEPVPVAVEQPPVAAQQAGPTFPHSALTAGFQTFQELTLVWRRSTTR